VNSRQALWRGCQCGTVAIEVGTAAIATDEAEGDRLAVSFSTDIAGEKNLKAAVIFLPTWNEPVNDWTDPGRRLIIMGVIEEYAIPEAARLRCSGTNGTGLAYEALGELSCILVVGSLAVRFAEHSG
jgi:hypothetical protein